jgi:hypothetical protein
MKFEDQTPPNSVSDPCQADHPMLSACSGRRSIQPLYGPLAALCMQPYRNFQCSGRREVSFNAPSTKPHDAEPSPNKTASATVLRRSNESPNRRTQPWWVQMLSTGSTPAASSIPLRKPEVFSCLCTSGLGFFDPVSTWVQDRPRRRRP